MSVHGLLIIDTSALLFFRYLKEDKPHGSAGGLYYFKDLIMEDNPVTFFGNFYENFWICDAYYVCD